MNGLTAEVGYVSLIKKGEELCGDRVETVRFEDSTTLVLADGLGSGVKANILSTLTSKIIATMMASGMPVEECVRTVTRHPCPSARCARWPIPPSPSCR